MIRQQFNNVLLTRTRVINNILNTYNKTSEIDRFDWYTEANLFALEISEIYNVSNIKVIGIISALSPLKTWEQNKKIAIDLILHKDCGQIKMFVGKALAILESDGNESTILNILKGKKISAFFLNILYPLTSDKVTIDRHALSISLGYKIADSEYNMTNKQYQFFVDCYKLAAIKSDTTPLIMQSSTWVYFRKQLKN